MKKKICDYDCFNCKYSDCIVSDKDALIDEKHNPHLKLTERKSIVVTDWKDPAQVRAYMLEKYYEHKEYYQKQSKKYYQKNRERIIQRTLENRRKRKERDAENNNDFTSSNLR